MSISLSHLTKRYGADAVVDDVNVEIPRELAHGGPRALGIGQVDVAQTHRRARAP